MNHNTSHKVRIIRVGAFVVTCHYCRREVYVVADIHHVGAVLRAMGWGYSGKHVACHKCMRQPAK